MAQEDLIATPRLRITEARLDDVEKGIVRLAALVMAQTGLREGEPVWVEGERNTPARAWPLRLEDDRASVLQMDGLTRENAQIGLDEAIRLVRAEVTPAATLLLAPQEKIILKAEDVGRMRAFLDGRVVTSGDIVNVPLYSRRGTRFSVAGVEPGRPVGAQADRPVGAQADATAWLVTEHTDVRIQDRGKTPEGTAHRVKYEDIGGLEDELTRIREMIELPMKYPELFARLRIEPPKGVLLYGPPGTGKTMIARAVAGEVKAHFIRINGPEVIHKFYGESEAKLREVFEEAQRKAPSVIFIDEIDAVAPRRDQVTGEVEKRVVAQLLALMDGMVSRGEVVVIGATNLPELLDHALRRPGRFDREVSVRVPNRLGRMQILSIHARGMPLADDVHLETLAETTHGFVGADLEVLCKEAGMHALQEVLHRDDFAERTLADLAAETRITMRHFQEALRGIEPTATREFFAERPNVRWDEVGGLQQAKALLSATLNLPTRYPRLSRAAGFTTHGGVLLTGVSGTGKTLLVRALASQSGLNYITVDAAALFSKWVGESEKALRQVFVKAKQAAPSILFFDELDSMFPRREQARETGGSDRLIGQFLAELDNLDALSEVVVVGATNREDLLDPALLAPGRFGLAVHLDLPDAGDRAEILRIHLHKLNLADEVDDAALAALAEKCDGFTGADLTRLCKRATLARLQAFVEEQGELADERAEDFALRMMDLEAAAMEILDALSGIRDSRASANAKPHSSNREGN